MNPDNAGGDAQLTGFRKMNRRTLLHAFAASLAATPSFSLAQARRGQNPVRVTICEHAVGLTGDPAVRKARWRSAFARHGLVDGENLVLTVVHGNALSPAASAEADRLAREVVAGRPDVILVRNVWLARVHRLTREIPIVFISMVDPEYHNYLASMRRPGSNVTGVRVATFETQEKRFEWLKELRRDARQMALVHAPWPSYEARIRAHLEALGTRLGMEPTIIHAPFDVEPAVLSRELRNARIDVADFSFPASVDMAAMLVNLGVLAAFPEPGSVRRGGLLSYDHIGIESIAVALAARILRGEKIATLPAEQPNELHFAFNLRTARALGVTVPQSILVRANEVIE